MQHSQSGPNWWPRVLRGAGDAKQGSVEDKIANQVNEALKRKTNAIQFSMKKIMKKIMMVLIQIILSRS